MFVRCDDQLPERPVEADQRAEQGLSGPLEQSTDGSSLRPLNVGDQILVNETLIGEDRLSYTFFDYQRGKPMLALTLLFVAAVVLLGRWRGVGAIAGLAASLMVLVVFMLPSLLAGTNPIAVALVGSAVIAFIALYLAHGFNVASSIALLGTFASLTLTGLLAWIFVEMSHFTGFVDESSYFLDAIGTGIDPRGLLLAGIVIGSLGVLDDVTVTQVSAVWELRRARPQATTAEVYRAAVRIGRDHISSTVNTLFLAYAGAALPLLLLFSEANQPISSIATREVVATEIVRSLVGSIGLVASVPITTGLAARVLIPTRRDGSRRVDAPPEPDSPASESDRLGITPRGYIVNHTPEGYKTEESDHGHGVQGCRNELRALRRFGNG